MADTESKYQQIYQHLCDCQDLAESMPDYELYDKFANMRQVINSKLFQL